MGLFSSCLKFVGRLAGKAVEKVGDVFDSDTLRDAGRAIQEFCADEVSSEKSYDKHTADIHSTERLAKVLAEFSKGLFDKCSSYEQTCIKYLEEYYNKLIEAIKQSSPDNNLSELKSLVREGRKIRNSVDKSIVNHIAKRVSLDDAECLQILKMDSGEEKREAFISFENKVINEALNALSKNVRESLNDCIGYISEYLTSISEKREKEVLQLKDCFQKMCLNDTLTKEEQERLCIMPSLIIAEADKIEQLLGEA